MPLPQTLVETLPAFVNAQRDMPVAANDRSRLVTISDDFIFDAMDPNGYAGGALPAVNAAIPAAGLVNLAPDAALGIPRTAAGAVTAIPRTPAQLPLFTGKGLRIVPGSNDALLVSKGNVTLQRVCEPTLEGYASHLMLVFYKTATIVNGSAPLGFGITNSTGQFGRFTQNGGGDLTFNPGAIALGGSGSGAWHCAATHIAFDTGANTATIRGYMDGLLAGTATASISANFAIVDYFACRASIGAQTNGNTFNGEIARVRRVYTTPWLAGLSTADAAAAIDAMVAAEFAWKMPLLLA
ncbi:hypothetical protein [Sphingomonas sp.]|jgi:hypothetical protein|uniref:hypothetical protein n=1 Tax=Sphingomonas sp. TaxID=28214 RepID=UPI002D80D7FF|nr:hypothetical protein [Sphingomonas sp.]HEU0045070.1 hypothetical protein [Sphingomonas sp.]